MFSVCHWGWEGGSSGQEPLFRCVVCEQFLILNAICPLLPRLFGSLGVSCRYIITLLLLCFKMGSQASQAGLGTQDGLSLALSAPVGCCACWSFSRFHDSPSQLKCLPSGAFKVDKDSSLCPQSQAGTQQNNTSTVSPYLGARWMEVFSVCVYTPGMEIPDPRAVSVLSLPVLVSQEPLQAASGWFWTCPAFYLCSLPCS